MEKHIGKRKRTYSLEPNNGIFYNSSIHDHHLYSSNCPSSYILNHSYVVENKLGSSLPCSHVQNALLSITFCSYPNKKLQG
ncbi:hypothetical protein CFOL_v3_28937 [Cephalotus follicularis]|uniref:Uncharacterized protein n=1 Tax=Cephalotus follicularis TaxID=3775 RepID=A0A1Q3CZD5_CEPFO|nr:hypothetical protein CFOL_v3_28937 [Cephalotus follicularis]